MSLALFEQTIEKLDAEKRARAIELLRTRMARRRESLALFRPLETQSGVFTTNARELLVRGGNRSGKSTSASVKFASEATGMSVYDHTGKECPRWFPKGKPLRMWIVAYDEEHIGTPIYRLLFEPGAFKIIRDPLTKKWRAFQRWNQWDQEHESESKDAEPLIPERFIKKESWAWKKKRQNIFKRVELVNGTVIQVYTSKAEPKKGDPVHVIWINEDLFWQKHYGEWQARLADYGGHLLWDAFPLNHNTALVNLSERCAEQAKLAKPKAVEVQLTFSGNAHFTKEHVDEQLDMWGEEECAARDRGEFGQLSAKMYPVFNDKIHCCPASDPKNDDIIDKILRRTDGVIPSDWCCDLILDPGHAKQGILLCAVPPPHLDVDCGIVFGEIFARRANADDIAKGVRLMSEGRKFRRFIMDMHGGQRTQEGCGKKVFEWYAEAFEREGLVSEYTGSGFAWSSDNVQGDCYSVRQALRRGANGRPWLRYLPNHAPNFAKQMSSYKKKICHDEARDEPAPDQIDELPDCIRYYVASRPTWEAIKQETPSTSWIYEFFKKHIQGDLNGRDPQAVCCGPGRAQ